MLSQPQPQVNFQRNNSAMACRGSWVTQVWGMTTWIPAMRLRLPTQGRARHPLVLPCNMLYCQHLTTGTYIKNSKTLPNLKMGERREQTLFQRRYTSGQQDTARKLDQYSLCIENLQKILANQIPQHIKNIILVTPSGNHPRKGWFNVRKPIDVNTPHQ